VAITRAVDEEEDTTRANGAYLPEASHGEIWVAGSSVTDGYFNRDRSLSQCAFTVCIRSACIHSIRGMLL
jgi:acyl-CoA synthetase (AMP-forming)/AMP-acid ligase II